jgi:hypothetical protein
MSQNWSNPAHSVVHGRLPGLGISHFYALQLIKPCPFSSTWSPWRLGISHLPFPSRVFWATFKRKLPYFVYSFKFQKKKSVHISSLYFLEITFHTNIELKKTFQQILYHPLSGYYCEVIYRWGLYVRSKVRTS